MRQIEQQRDHYDGHNHDRPIWDQNGFVTALDKGLAKRHYRDI